MPVTDKRIVQMEFDNSQFDRKIAKSQKTLEDFKEELDFDEASKSVRNFSSSVDSVSFNKMETNIQRLTDKFTGLGDAGEYVISRIRRQLESLAGQIENTLKDFSLAQIPVGLSKYDAMNKSIQTMMAAGVEESEAEEVFSRLMKYTDQTSFSFAEMSNQLSTFISLGQDMWTAEHALEGFSNMTAKAGKGAAEASQAINIFAKAMGNNYLGLQQWISLNQSAHIITDDFRKTIIDVGLETQDLIKKGDKIYTNAKKYGKQLEVTAQNLESTLRYKWFSNDLIMTLAGRYYFEKGDDPLKATDEELQSFAGVAYLAAQKAMTFADAMNAIKESVSSGWLESFQHIFGSATEAAELFTNICNRIIESLEGIKEARNSILEAWSNYGGRDSLITALLGDYEKEIKTGAYGLVDFFDGIGKTISDGFWKFIGLFAPEEYRDILFNSADKAQWRAAFLGHKLADFSKKIKDFFTSVHSFFHESVEINGRMTTRLTMIKDIVSGIAGAVKIATSVIGGILHFFHGLSEKLSPSADAIANLFSAIGLGIYDTAKAEEEGKGIWKFFDNLLALITPLTSAVNTLVGSISSMLIEVIDWGKKSGFFDLMLTAFTSFVNGVAAVIDHVGTPIVTFFSNIFSIIKDLFDKGFDEAAIANIGPKLGKAIVDLFNGILGALPKDLEWIGNIFRDLFGLWEEDIERETIFTKIHDFFEGGFSFVFDTLKMLFGMFSDFNIGTWLKSGMGIGTAYNIISTFTGWFKSTNLYGMVMAFLGIATLATLWRTISQAKAAVANVRAFFEDVGGNLKAGLIGEYEYFSEKFLRIAEAIALLATSVYILGNLFHRDPTALIAGTVALLGIIGAFYLLAKYIDGMKATKFNQDIKLIALGSLAVGLAVFCVAVGVLAIALLPLSSDINKMITAMSALSWIIIAFSAFVGLMNLIPAKSALKVSVIAASLSAFAVGVGLLVLAIQPFKNLNPTQFINVITGLGWVLAELIGFMILTSVLPIGTKQLGGFIGFALSLAILIFALQPFTTMSFDQYVNALTGLGWVLAELIGFMILTSVLPIGTKQLGGFIGFALSLAILIFALQPFTTMSFDQYVNALTGLGWVLAELVGFMILTSVLPIGTKQLGGFIGFALSLAVLIFALQPFTTMSFDQYVNALTGLGWVLAELIGFMILTSVLPIGTKQLGGFIGFALSLAILIFALQPFTTMSYEQYVNALTGLGWILVELIAFMTIMSALKIKTKQLTGFLAFAVSLWIVVSAIMPMTTVSWAQLQNAISGFGYIVMEMVMLVGIMKALVKDERSMLTMSVMLLAVGATMVLFSIALNETKNMKWEQILNFVKGFGIAVLAISAAIAITSKLGSLKGVLLLAAAVAAIIAVFALLGPWLLSSLSSGLVELSASLSLMSTLLGNFSNSMGNVDEGNIGKAEGILGRIKGMVTDLGFYAGAGLEYVKAFSSAMYELGTGLEIFQNHAQNINPETVLPLDMIKSLADSATNLDILSKINLNALTSQISGLGGAMTLYAVGAERVYGSTLDETPNVEAASRLLREVSASFADEGGFVIPSMPSEEDLGLFGAQLAALAGALVLFEEAGAKLGNNTQKALETLDFFVKIRRKIKEQDFDFDTVNEVNQATNVDALSMFGKNIEQLGISLKQFAQSTSDVDAQTGNIVPISYDKPIEALNSFVEIKNKLPDMGGLVDLIIGKKQSLIDLSKEIEALTGAIISFSKKVTGAEGGTPFDANASIAAVNTIDSMITFLEAMKNKLPKVGGLAGIVSTLFSGRNTNLEDIGGQLDKLGDGLAKLSEHVSGKFSNVTDVENSLNVVTDLINMITALGAADKGFYFGNVDTYVTGLNEFLDMFVNGYNDEELNWNTGPIYYLTEIVKQMDAAIKGLGDINTENIGVFEVVTRALANLNNIDMTKSYEAIGESISSGIAVGIRKGENLVSESAKFIAIVSYVSAMAALNAHSPSKKFIEIGGYSAEGLAIGMENGEGSIRKSAEHMADTAIKYGASAFDLLYNSVYSYDPLAEISRAATKAEQERWKILQDSAHWAFGVQQDVTVNQTTSSDMFEKWDEWIRGSSDKGKEMGLAVSTAFDENLDPNPTITPVLDLTQLRAGIGIMNSLLGGQSTINTTAASINAARNVPVWANHQIEPKETDLSEVYNRIDQVTSTMQGFGTQLAQMKIVLDTGIVAGGVTNGVDMNLGRKMMYAGRKN